MNSLIPNIASMLDLEDLLGKKKLSLAMIPTRNFANLQLMIKGGRKTIIKQEALDQTK